MASQEVDIGQLSESQRLALEQYTAVTNQEVEAAIPLLQRSQWNLQVCLLCPLPDYYNIANPIPDRDSEIL
jgi:UBA-like domain